MNWVVNRKAEVGSVKRNHGLFPPGPANTSKLVRSQNKPKDALKRTSTISFKVVYEAIGVDS